MEPEGEGGAEYALALSALLRSALGINEPQKEILQDALMMCLDTGSLSLIDLREKVREVSASELRSAGERIEAERLYRVLGSLLSLKGAEKLMPEMLLTLSILTDSPTVMLLSHQCLPPSPRHPCWQKP